MMKKISYRDYLMSNIASALSSLADGMNNSIQFQHEGEAVDHLEKRMASAAYLLTMGNPNPERVEPRPEPDDA